MFDPFHYLFSLEPFGIKFGLENISTIVEALDHPERSFQSVHVAGTNGKGSVTAMLEAALRAAGHRTGRYTSPHLVELSERFVVEGTPVDAETLRSAITDVAAVVEDLRRTHALLAQPTFFEVTTAVAFEVFRRRQVQIAVCEVGLGGRLDATNILSPAISAITSIGLDHEQYLGRTVTEIAAEKAGIIKPGVPVVVGRLQPEAFDVIERIAVERGASIVPAFAGTTVEPSRTNRGDARSVRIATGVRDYGDVHLALAGAHQIDNAVLAVRVLETLAVHGVDVPAGAIKAGLTTVRWPGRMDLRRLGDGREALLDAAHNPDGAAALAAELSAHPPCPLVFSVMKDKDIDGMLRALAPVVSALIVTKASSPRSSEPTDVAVRAHRLAPDLPVIVQAEPRAALAEAWNLSPRITIAGSIFLLGDIMNEVGGT